MNHPLVNLLVRWLILALGVTISAKLVPGIHCDTGMTLLVVVALLSLFNTFLKPLLVIFTLPFVILSLGIGIWIINAVLFMFVGKLVDGFAVDGFGSALIGSAVVSVTNMVMTRVLSRASRPRPPSPPKSDDIIDI
jgi:putative membrane protein